MRLNRASRIFVGFMVAVVVCRAAWVASRTEGGWGILGDHMIAGLPPPLHRADFDREPPSAQKCRWLLREADRITADPDCTAADCMGAALVLACVHRGESLLDPRQLGLVIWKQRLRSDPSFESTDDPFKRAWTESAELAVKATELEPGRKDWWRLRAVLMNF